MVRPGRFGRGRIRPRLRSTPRLLGNEVGRDEAGSAGVLEVTREPIDAVAVDEVEVRHDLNGCARGGNLLDHSEQCP